MTANAKSKTYGDANPALDATVAGTVNGDTLNYSLATTAVQTSGVGSYPITVTLGSNPELHDYGCQRQPDDWEANADDHPGRWQNEDPWRGVHRVHGYSSRPPGL